MNRRSLALGQALAMLCFAACSGTIKDGEELVEEPGGPAGSNQPGGGSPTVPGGSNVPGGGGGGAGSGGPVAPPEPGVAPLRRLTVREYTNTVRDLLGVPVARAGLSVDQDAAGFAIGGPVSTSIDAARLLDSADQLATAASTKISSLLPCPNVAADGEAACAKSFIQQFGKRAFRRPLDNAEVDELLAVYTSHRDASIGAPFPEAIRSVVAAMLTSPFFLYRAELGPAKALRDGSFVRFNSYEMASRLSYALWATMPDDVLFTEADAGRLTTPQQIEQQARRMLKDARLSETITDFHMQWLEVEGLPGEPDKDARFTQYTPELVQAMLAETTTFVNDLLAGPQASGSIDKFFTATATSVDPALAKLYGLANVTGVGAKPATLNATERAGILTQASFLAMHAAAGESHPVRRGAMLMRRVLCQEIPAPNMDVGTPKPAMPGETTRERFAEHAKQECATCHKMTDPLGFAFEHYDAIGMYRTQDQGKPVDATGAVEFPRSGKITFTNAVDLVKQLPKVVEVQECMATQWLRYMLRRNEFTGDEASLKLAQAALGKSSGDLREMLLALVTSKAFTHRMPSLGEVLP